ncbi:hypothetical protein HELRODRAFT_162785 [Helobdella robusta]|uniref:Uncharacterized protein n=1 Tax=Helobdella robusta TaxID=6412 RepID=T1ET52_HELRO|nr:hypothetical protein HELRODRAFT_162785 [Helobdella robusta]ESN99267.1 hypothetical protein HELRODRAFT_162785 [Helobdella robusta]
MRGHVLKSVVVQCVRVQAASPMKSIRLRPLKKKTDSDYDSRRKFPYPIPDFDSPLRLRVEASMKFFNYNFVYFSALKMIVRRCTYSSFKKQHLKNFPNKKNCLTSITFRSRMKIIILRFNEKFYLRLLEPGLFSCKDIGYCSYKDEITKYVSREIVMKLKWTPIYKEEKCKLKSSRSGLSVCQPLSYLLLLQLTLVRQIFEVIPSSVWIINVPCIPIFKDAHNLRGVL